MLDFSPKNSGKRRASQMTASVLREARGHVAALIGRQPPGAKLKAAWPRIARLVGLTERRIRAIWHSEARSIRADEMDALRAAANESKSKSHVANHAAQIEAAARALEAASPSLHRAEIDRLRDAARRLRDLDDGALNHG